MKKKGFTLVELLAVIVVLAIIALIATPIVLNLINTAKKGAAEASTVSYVKAVENYIVLSQMDDVKYPIKLEANTTYQVSNTSRETAFLDLIIDTVYAEENDQVYLNDLVKLNGTLPKSGTVTIGSNGKVSEAELNINNFSIVYDAISGKAVVQILNSSNDLTEVNSKIDTLEQENQALKLQINNLSTYSAQEIEIGTWMGKPLYRKTFKYGAAEVNSNVQVGILNNADVAFIDESASYFKCGNVCGLYSSGSIFSINTSGRNVSDLSYATYATISSNQVHVLFGTNTNASEIVVTVNYTKTTD